MRTPMLIFAYEGGGLKLAKNYADVLPGSTVILPRFYWLYAHLGKLKTAKTRLICPQISQILVKRIPDIPNKLAYSPTM